jgi:hypothetical protein
MGEAKRRKESIGDEYGKEERIVPWLPITKTQSEDFVKWTSRGSWMGISLLVAWWIGGLSARRRVGGRLTDARLDKCLYSWHCVEFNSETSC